MILFRGDTLTMLERLAGKRPFSRPLVYLDAHWWGEIPVTGELRLLRGAWEHAVVVIDDFIVDDDPGYQGDGQDGTYLSLNPIDGISLPGDAVCAYPGVRSEDETGARRGTLYVGWGDGRNALDALAA